MVLLIRLMHPFQKPRRMHPPWLCWCFGYPYFCLSELRMIASQILLKVTLILYSQHSLKLDSWCYFFICTYFSLMIMIKIYPYSGLSHTFVSCIILGSLLQTQIERGGVQFILCKYLHISDRNIGGLYLLKFVLCSEGSAGHSKKFERSI